MATMRTIAALLLVVVAVAAAGDLPSRQQFRRWVRECRKDSFIAKAKPLYAMKKTISGMYNPSTRHAFRKSQVTFSKFEFATIRKPTEAEKCLVECIAEKQGLINGSQLNSEKIVKVMMAFAKHYNEVSPNKKVNATLLKRNTAKCIVGTHGSAKTCELGFNLFQCLKTAIIESIYVPEPQSTTARYYPTTPRSYPTTARYYPTSTESTTGETEEATNVPSPANSSPQPERFERRPFMGYKHHHMGYRRFPPPTPSDMPAPPQMPLNGVPPPQPPMAYGPPQPMAYHSMPPPPPPGMLPPPMGFNGVAPPPSGMEAQPMIFHQMHPVMSPAFVAYRQGSGVVQVYGENPAPWRQHWRAMHGGPRMMAPMI